MTTAHLDTFAADHLPPREQQPEFVFDLPGLQFPAQLNCAAELLDRVVADGRGGRSCLLAPGLHWTYAELQSRVDRIANVLVHEMGLVPGNRVLLRAPNHPMTVACWFAVVKAGGVVVATMPMLRARELVPIIEKARVTHALCDARLEGELALARRACPTLAQVRYFNAGTPGAVSATGISDTSDTSDTPDTLEAAMARQPDAFGAVATAADDTCLIAFTSGTTGEPKGTMHFHRDVMAACACWPAHVLRPRPDDVFIGSPPIAFTFGLGGLVLFPLAVGASSVLLERASPEQLIEGIEAFGATLLFTAPTSYRAMAVHGARLRATRLARCVSAGEALPAATRALWKEATGIELIDGIGATEMLHIFISADEANARPGATGKVVPGYEARVVDEAGVPLPVGQVGRLAVRGPTGCRYLADARQTQYVQNGWNLTGDAYLLDADGYFHYQSRTDDMIVSAGYNIAAPEVEAALLLHPRVAECAVIGVTDAERGQIVKAFVVLRTGEAAGSDTAQAQAPTSTQTKPQSQSQTQPQPQLQPQLQTQALVRELQDFVKQTLAPYKYPRAIEFRDALPRTETGKLQRFRLRDAV